MATQSRLGRLLRRFATDDRGATAIEYALVAVGIACVVAATIRLVGGTLNTEYFQKIQEETRN